MTESSSRIHDGELIAAIQQRQAQLHAALQQKDWELIPQLDQQLRELVQLAVDSLQTTEGKLALQTQLQEIQTFYHTLIELGTAHRNNLAQEIQQLRKNSSAVNQYLNSSFSQR